MAKLTDFQKVRKQRARKKLAKRVLFFTAFVTLIFLAIFVLDYAEEHEIGAQIDSYFGAVSDGEGFPIGISGAEVTSIKNASGNIVLVSSGQILTYNRKGALVSNIKHSYFGVDVACTRSKTMLYDRGGKKLSVYTGDTKSLEKEFPRDIYCATMNMSGVLAVGVRAEKYRGEVLVYNKKFEEILCWGTADGNITDIALPDSGTGVAVAAVETEGGAIKSVVNILDTLDEGYHTKIQFPGELVVNMSYSSKDQSLYILTDKGAYEVSRGGIIISTHNFGGKTLWAYDFADGVTLVALGNYTEKRELEIIRLDEGLIPSETLLNNERIIDLCVEGKNSYILTDNLVREFDDKMQPLNNYPAHGAQAMQAISGKVYYTNDEKLELAQAVVKAPAK